MTLYIDLQQGLDSLGHPLEPQVWLNLYAISREDGNFGEVAPPGDPSVTQVEYKGAAPTPQTATRLYELANTTFDLPIVVTGLAGGMDPYSGMDVTGNGFTYVDSTSSTFAGGLVRVVYDLNQCNGAGIVGFDITNKRITTPNPVLLYHELSHAFRAAKHQTDPVNDEIPAETDENVMRSELGLCLRDVNNHGGDCGPPADDCGGSTGDPHGCFIVSATTGSPASVEVSRLRRLRARVGAASRLAAELIDVIYGEYYQFSPGIVAQIHQDAAAREAVLGIVVRPLLAWYTLAGTLALEQADQKAISDAVADVLRVCPSHVGASSIAAVLETLRSNGPLPPDAPHLLLDFAPKVREAARFHSASWAILDPLVRVWTSAARGGDLVEEVAQWLATAPLEMLAAPPNRQLLDVELRALAGFLSFRPMAVRQIGMRLARAWPDALDALIRQGFVEQGGHDKQDTKA
jgi:hypothetical protein